MDGHHIIPANQKLMRYEDLKIHIAEVERCQKHTRTKSVPPVLYFGKSMRKWDPATQARRSLTWKHHKQNRHPYPRCLLISRIFISFAMISNNKVFQNFTQIPGLSLPISTRNFLQGHMEADRNGKMSSGRTYNWHSICLDEVISSCRITLFSDILWNSNTWLSIDGFICLNH